MLRVLLGVVLGLALGAERVHAEPTDSEPAASAKERVDSPPQPPRKKPATRKPAKKPPVTKAQAARAQAAKAKAAKALAAAEQAAADKAAADKAAADKAAADKAAAEQAIAEQAAKDRAAREALEVAAKPAVGDRVTEDFIANQKDGVKLFRREARAARRSGPIQIDGILDEKAWSAAPPARFDWEERPNEGAKATGATEFQVLYDDKALYVAVHALDPEPDKIAGILHSPLGLSKIPQSDWIIVYIDPALNRRLAYTFAVNPAGVKMDLRQYPGEDIDDTYQAVWEAETTRDKTGWYAEFRIPYSQMRVRDGYQDRWGFEIQRKVSRTQERDYWSPFTFASGTDVTGYGNLAIEGKIDAGRPIEILPYVLGGTRLESGVASDDKLNSRVAPKYGVGADVKMQVSRSLRLTASINPDFGQVEADPSEVNLTDKEIFFSERRPLFIEDADLYQLKIGRDNENFFYSRRIGAAPAFSQADTARYVSEPDATTIYGAAKLSGELGGGINIGLLSALGARETSRGQLADGSVNEVAAAPTTLYNVAQLNKSFRGGSSDLRADVTEVSRLGDGGDTNTVLHRNAYAGALQYLHQFADNHWALFGMFGGSRVEGDPQSIALTQTASQRYFQRPDATHVHFDPTRTSLSGYTFNTQLKKIAGTYHGELGVDGRSPGFEVNDLGFLTDADLLNPWLRISREDPSVGGDVLQSVSVSALGESFTNFAPEVLRHRASLSADLTFSNFWNAGASLQYTRALLDTHLLRGGPAVHGEDSINGTAYLGTDITKDFQVSANSSVTSRPESHSLQVSGGLGLVWNLRSNFELSVSPTVVRNIDDSQYVGTSMDATGTNHYVLAHLRQTTLVATTRLNYTISPRMSLQLYAQPFLSGGSYSRFKESGNVRAPSYKDRFLPFNSAQVVENMGNLDIDVNRDGVADFSVPKPDFQVGALISNLVFRWEYLPGSNLYLIWSQSRNGFKPDGAIGSSDLGNVFTNPSVHVVIVKLSYWWNL